MERARRLHCSEARRRSQACPSLDEVEIPIVVVDDERLLAVDEALEQFAAIEPLQG